MKLVKHIIIILFLISVSDSFSQVGIGTTAPDPSSILDVVATDKGLLAPRVSLDNISTTMIDGINTAATGLLIYNTNAAVVGGNGVGYYYFNGAIWEQLKTTSSISDHDFYEEGTTTSPNSINDDIYTQGNVAIGKSTASYTLDIESTTSRGISTVMNSSINGTIYGHFIDLINTGNGTHFGLLNLFRSPGDGDRYGIRNNITNNGNGEHIGNENLLSGSGTGRQFGAINEISNTGDNWHYGVYNRLIGTGNGTHIGSRNAIANNGLGNHFGTQNLISGTGNGLKFGMWNDISNSGNSLHFGTANLLSGTGTGTQTGSRNTITNTGNGIHYGTHNVLDSSGSGIDYGSYNEMTGSGDGTQFGVRSYISNTGNSSHIGTSNSLTGIGTGIKYGTRNIINVSAGGTHFGVYSSALKAGGFSGFFVGNVAIGTVNYPSATPNYYLLPASRGTANQIMQTDAIGNVTWVDDSTVGTDDQTLSYNASTGQLTIEDGNSVNLAVGDITEVTAGDGLIGGGTTGTLNVDIAATNGITANTDDIVLGGTLNQNTTITQDTFDMIFDLNSSGNFSVQDNGTNHFEVRSSGLTYFGDDTYWNDGSTTGTTLARLYDDGSGDDGVFEIYKDGVVQHQFHSAGTSVINELGQDFDFRIEGNTESNLFYTDAGQDRIGVLTNTPGFDIHVAQSNTFVGGTGGMGFSTGTNNWKIYHSGLHFSFDENGTRRAYVTGGTGAYVVTSDRRLKKNISEMETILSKLNILKTYRYLYKDQADSEKETLGFMAQDAQKLFPELVETGEDGYLGLNYAGFSVIAVKAIQEQQQIIDTQQQQIEALQNSEVETTKLLSSLLMRIEKLENQD